MRTYDPPGGPALPRACSSGGDSRGHARDDQLWECPPFEGSLVSHISSAPATCAGRCRRSTTAGGRTAAVASPAARAAGQRLLRLPRQRVRRTRDRARSRANGGWQDGAGSAGNRPPHCPPWCPTPARTFAVCTVLVVSPVAVVPVTVPCAVLRERTGGQGPGQVDPGAGVGAQRAAGAQAGHDDPEAAAGHGQGAGAGAGAVGPAAQDPGADSPVLRVAAGDGAVDRDPECVGVVTTRCRALTVNEAASAPTRRV